MQNTSSKGIGPQDHALIGEAANIPVTSATQYISVSPVTLKYPGRPVDLQLRITFPASGKDLPIILLSHGHGPLNNLSSLNGYAPLVQFWASHGFCVIQPTHLSSRSLSLPADSAGGGMLFWPSRVHDMKFILDHMNELEASVPLVQGRLDRGRVAVVGHSIGGQTAGMLLGLRLTDPDDGSVADMAEPRIKAGVLLTPPGNGGDDLSTWARQAMSFYTSPSFRHMATPALVVVGDVDVSPHLTVRGADWHADAYNLAPGPKSLLTLPDAKHSLGGIVGFDAAPAEDENITNVAVVQRMTLAYLSSKLYGDDGPWKEAYEALNALDGVGKVENK